jgi:hypothetical protein
MQGFIHTLGVSWTFVFVKSIKDKLILNNTGIDPSRFNAYFCRSIEGSYH